MLPELIRLKGESLLATEAAATEQAAVLFHPALAMANDSGASALTMRAAMSPVRMERSAATLSLLKQANADLEEGFLTVDYVEAQALLT